MKPLEDGRVLTDGCGYDGGQVVLAGCPADGVGVGAGVDGMAADGGVDAPARQDVAVPVCDREDPAGVVGVDDATGSAWQRGRVRDTPQEGRVDEGVRYRDDSSLARGEHATALGRGAAYSKVATGWYRSRI